MIQLMHDNSSLISMLILLALFIGIPALLKRLGQYTQSSRNAPGPHEEDKAGLPQGPPHDEEEGPLFRHAAEKPDRGSSSNKPIHPKWF